MSLHANYESQKVSISDPWETTYHEQATIPTSLPKILYGTGDQQLQCYRCEKVIHAMGDEQFLTSGKAVQRVLQALPRDQEYIFLSEGHF